MWPNLIPSTNIERIANAVQCDSYSSCNKDCHQLMFSIVRITISVSNVSRIVFVYYRDLLNCCNHNTLNDEPVCSKAGWKAIRDKRKHYNTLEVITSHDHDRHCKIQDQYETDPAGLETFCVMTEGWFDSFDTFWDCSDHPTMWIESCSESWKLKVESCSDHPTMWIESWEF